MNADERRLLHALREMTAGPKPTSAEASPLSKLASRVRKALKPDDQPIPLAELASRVRKALTPPQRFDAKAWAESVVKVRPGRRGRGAEVVIGDAVEEHWTTMTEAKGSCARIREALIASLPDHLVSR